MVIGAVLLMTDPAAAMRDVSDKFLDGASPQTVEVIVDDRKKSMVVDDLALVKDLPRNERATAIFRSQYVELNPESNPERLPYIAGPAVIFDQKCF